MGGILGILLSYFLTWAIGMRPFLADLLEDVSGRSGIHLILSADVVVVATLILVVVGLLSGFWPAMRASRMNPIESLRYE